MVAAIPDLGGYDHGQVPRSVREAQILALGEELFAERGYTGMTMNELALRTGVTKPVIYSIVRSKDHLYRRCFQRAADELAAAVSAAAQDHLGDLASMLRAGNLAFFHFIQSHASAFAMLFAEDAGGRHAAHVDAVRARQAQLLTAVLTEQAAATGHAIDARQVELGVHVINGGAEALAHWWRKNPGMPAEQLADTLTNLLLPGLRGLTESHLLDQSPWK